MRLLIIIALTCLTVTQVLAVNLIDNGDFEQGVSGFSSNYVNPPFMTDAVWNEGTYAVTNNPAVVHSYATSFGDHTTGTGYMLVANGSPNSMDVVWSHLTSQVSLETDFTCTVWATSWYNYDPANLDIWVNDRKLESYQLTGTVGEWEPITVTFNSGQEDWINISIRDANPNALGNDFALDDMSLSLTAEVSPSVNPEPATVLLLACGGISLFSRRTFRGR